MAPFICYSEVTKIRGEENRKLIFLNTDFISKATYNEKDESPELICQANDKGVNKGDWQIVTIPGQEAKDAVEVLKRL